MDINGFIANERKQKSPCCDARIQIVYKSVNSVRVAVVYACLKCDRLHVIDSREEQKINALLEQRRAN